MTTGVTCTVYVDGVRAADGSPGDVLTDPIVLDELSVTWGRSDTMSQPDPDTCTFEVMDQLGGQAFLAQYRTGRRVDVVARGETWPDPDVPTFTNPGFESDVVTWQATGGTATRSTRRAYMSDYSLAVTPTVSGSEATVLLAPGPFQPSGTNPGAWDAIPTTSVGQTWAWAVKIWAPLGATAIVRPVGFSGPYADATTSLGATVVMPGQGDWQLAEGEFVAPVDGEWLGLTVTMFPTGPTWDDMPPAQTWNGVDPSVVWDEMGLTYLDDVVVLSPGGGTSRGVLVFSGRITDLGVAWNDDTDSPVVEVACVGFTADLENRNIGGEPWPVEALDVRANRILTLSGLPVSIDIDSPIDDTLVTWRDVDSQGATGLLRELAVSVDGVLWPAVHQSLGAYLRLEDPGLRAALLELTTVEIGSPPVVTVRTNLSTNPGFETQIGPWGGSTGTTNAGRTSTWSHEGTYSFRVQTLASSSATVGDVRMGTATTFPPNIVPGGTYTVSAWQNTPAAHITFSTAETSRQRRIMLFYSLNGSTFTQLMGPQGANIAGVQRLAFTFTVPAGATGCILAIGCAGSVPDSSFVSFVDDVLIESGSTLGDSFTGATPDTEDTVYEWTGTPQVSTSTATTTTPGTLVDQIVIGKANPTTGFDLSACSVLRDPVTWVQTVADVVTRVSVTWQVQGVDEDGNPTTTESTVHEIDAGLEALYGTRGASVTTQLQAAEDALDVAERILARTSPEDWRADGLTVEDDDIPAGADGVALLLDMLDGTSRIGAPIVLGELPIWSPSGASAGVYLEGGTYTYASGRWVLELLVSSATGLGQSAAWDDLDPSWTWDQWAPSITWNDLRGVTAP